MIAIAVNSIDGLVSLITYGLYFVNKVAHSPEKSILCRVATLAVSCHTKMAGSSTLTMILRVLVLRDVIKAEPGDAP